MGSELAPRPRKSASHYTEEEIYRGLAEVALCAGNTHRAARQLSAQGMAIPRGTLEKWANRQHVDRYARVREELLPKIHAQIAADCEELAALGAQLERETLEKYREELPNLRASEAASAVRNIATSKAINVDKATLLRNRPTQIVEHRDASELIRKLEAVGVIEGSVSEID